MAFSSILFCYPLYTTYLLPILLYYLPTWFWVGFGVRAFHLAVFLIIPAYLPPGCHTCHHHRCCCYSLPAGRFGRGCAFYLPFFLATPTPHYHYPTARTPSYTPRARATTHRWFTFCAFAPLLLPPRAARGLRVHLPLPPRAFTRTCLHLVLHLPCRPPLRARCHAA